MKKSGVDEVRAIQKLQVQARRAEQAATKRLCNLIKRIKTGEVIFENQYLAYTIVRDGDINEKRAQQYRALDEMVQKHKGELVLVANTFDVDIGPLVKHAFGHKRNVMPEPHLTERRYHLSLGILRGPLLLDLKSGKCGLSTSRVVSSDADTAVRVKYQDMVEELEEYLHTLRTRGLHDFFRFLKGDQRSPSCSCELLIGDEFVNKWFQIHHELHMRYYGMLKKLGRSDEPEWLMPALDRARKEVWEEIEDQLVAFGKAEIDAEHVRSRVRHVKTRKDRCARVRVGLETLLIKAEDIGVDYEKIESLRIRLRVT